MATIFKFVTHDAVNNTLQATWLDEIIDPATLVVIGYVPSRCTNYSAAEKAQFLSDVGAAIGQKYVTMAGW